MDKQLLETYSDYLMSSFGYTTATGLSMMVEGDILLPKIMRELLSRGKGIDSEARSEA